MCNLALLAIRNGSSKSRDSNGQHALERAYFGSHRDGRQTTLRRSRVYYGEQVSSLPKPFCDSPLLLSMAASPY